MTHGGFNDDDAPLLAAHLLEHRGRPAVVTSPVRFGNEPPFPGLGCPQPATSAELAAP